MSLSASRALANALRSTLWMVAYYSDMNKHGPTLRTLQIAMGRAIVELEAEATFKLNAASHRPEREARDTAQMKQRA